MRGVWSDIFEYWLLSTLVETSNLRVLSVIFFVARVDVGKRRGISKADRREARKRVVTW